MDGPWAMHSGIQKEYGAGVKLADVGNGGNGGGGNENPYLTQLGSQVSALNNETAVGLGQYTASAGIMQNYHNQMNQTQGLDSAYPTYPNAAGLGSQRAYQGPQSTGTTSGSFNPWSLQGEAMAR